MSNPNRKVTENIFKAIKILCESKTPRHEISKYMGVSTWTISIINSCDDFQDYINAIAAMNAKNNARRKKQKEEETDNNEPQKTQEPVPQIVEHRQTITVQATHYMMEEMKKTNELLTTISAKLAFIVDELTK